MQRTFSLARVFLGTVLAFLIFLLGFAPLVGAEIALLALYVAPTIGACALTIYFSRDRVIALICCVVGMMFGSLLVPGIMVSFDDWQTFIHSYTLVTFPTALCAALVGIIFTGVRT